MGRRIGRNILLRATVVCGLFLFLPVPGRLVAWVVPAQRLQAQNEIDRREQARQHNERRIALARQGKNLEAVGEFRAATEAFPNDADAYYNLGVTLNQLGDSDQAFDAFRSAARLRPSSAPIRLQLGAALLQKQRLDEAIRELRQTIALDPRSPEAHYNLGLALKEGHETDAALQEFETALRLKPDYVEALYNRAIRRRGDHGIKRKVFAVHYLLDLLDGRCCGLGHATPGCPSLRQRTVALA